jgi:hypothetical protein
MMHAEGTNFMSIRMWRSWQHDSHVRSILRFSAACWVFLSLEVNVTLCRAQQGNASLEAQVKAAYIYHMSEFINWGSAESDSTGSTTIYVVGDDPIIDALIKASRRSVEGSHLVVKRIGPSQLLHVERRLVFLGKTESHSCARILSALKESGALTVSDISGFTAQGGMIGFVLDNGHVKIEINMDAVNDAGLRISAKLLEVARIVGGES